MAMTIFTSFANLLSVDDSDRPLGWAAYVISDVSRSTRVKRRPGISIGYSVISQFSLSPARPNMDALLIAAFMWTSGSSRGL